MSEAMTLVEQAVDWRIGAHVERDARLVRNVALAGPASKNGYRYAETALRDGAALYDRKPVFLDHAADPRRPQERSTRDLVGSVIHPRFEGGRIRGDIQVLDTEAGQTFLSLVESDAPGVGMSHVVLAERGGDGTIVERIHDVLSVDAVIGPATTTTFRESIDAGASDDTASAGESTETQLSAVLRERDELAARIAMLERRQSEESAQIAVQRLLEASGLPEYAATPLFVQQLSAAAESQRRPLIAERRELIARAASLRPRSAERRDGGASADSAFVAVIRGRRR
jgi:hypothetical protein